MSHLPNLMKTASAELQLSLTKIRSSSNHSLSIGQNLESSVRKFLRTHLHDGVGIAQGQIVDTAGSMSSQLDIILYDAAATPTLFLSEDENHRLIPVEGVIGVVEVKSELSASTLPSIIQNMQSVKALRKSAFHQETAPRVIETGYNLFGEELDHFPVIYSLFAFDSSSFENLVPAFREQNDSLAASQRIDNTCLLDKGVIANETESGQLDAIPGPRTQSAGLPTEHALLTWYIMIQRLYSQAKIEPINMQAYLGEGFYF